MVRHMKLCQDILGNRRVITLRFSYNVNEVLSLAELSNNRRNFIKLILSIYEKDQNKISSAKVFPYTENKPVPFVIS